jgi:hypothetical protein
LRPIPLRPKFHAHSGQIEIGSEDGISTVDVTATVMPEPDRTTYYAQHQVRFPGFAQHQSRTTRVIPVVSLEPQPPLSTP